ncbi:hypothetical protein [Agromyces sp. SYSU T0242]|uniref:hypothetical protein n=1 Tax=Agromyces litoreus TaxID=3158561 RepID=UPI0033908851
MADSVVRNEYGEVVFVQRPSAPGARALVPNATAQQVADYYLRTMPEEIGLADARLVDTDEAPRGTAGRAPALEFATEREIAGNPVVVYRQTAMGLEVFGATVGFQIDGRTMELESTQSSAHGSVEIENPEALQPAGETRKVTKPALRKHLGFDLPNLADARIERQVVYRYEPDEREEHEEGACIGGPGLEIPHLKPTTIDGLAKGQHYVVDEILFRASLESGQAPVNWRALVEPESGDVLYLRPLVAAATGLVFHQDPQTQNGTAITAAASDAQLNPFRTSHAMAGIAPATPQPLTGNFVRVADTQSPAAAPPTIAMSTGQFGFAVRSDEFAATCAYYNCDRLFRTMQDFGFNVGSYFGGTTFPVPVDHRALGDAINAQAPGNATGTGLLELRFGRMMPGQPVGIATSNRVAWHEFGHGLLWDHVSSPNFGFAHSAGDGLAAILNDPDSQSADRFDTFPWVHAGLPGLDRRHDRSIASGWAWFGPNWNTQYGGEQVLSTTLFRIYRAIGGDAGNVVTRRRAAETTAFLVFKAIGQMTAMTPFPEVFEGQLETADRTTPTFKGIAGGALHKVARWAFEKQGLFQPGAAPGQPNTVSTEGLPPDVDVYIDDGRAGEYQYQANHWSCQDMWVRRSADGGTTHEQPIVGATNYMYVRVKNRGTHTADEVRVDAYHALPGAGLTFPGDWTPMTTATLPGASIPSGGSTVVGPFAFVPTQVGHECLLAVAHAAGDPGNDTTITGPIPEHRLVPFDNNIGQRNVSPVHPSVRGLMKLLHKHVIWVRNPFRRVVTARVEVELPRFMRELGWELEVRSDDGPKFELGPRERREVVLSIRPGRHLDPAAVKRAIAKGDHEIAVPIFLDDDLVGGMSYRLSFDADPGQRPFPKPEKPGRPDTPHRPQKPSWPRGAVDDGDRFDADEDAAAADRTTIDEVLDLLGSGGATGNRRIRTVRMEFDLEEDED